MINAPLFEGLVGIEVGIGGKATAFAVPASNLVIRIMRVSDRLVMAIVALPEMRSIVANVGFAQAQAAFR